MALSIRAGISKMIIEATTISIGTTLPEASVSVMSAISGARIWPSETRLARSSATPC